MARWRTKAGNYEIVSRQQFCGTRYVERFYALVICRRFDGKTMRPFVGRRAAYKSFDAARKAVRTHRHRWRKFIRLGEASGNRQTRLKELTKKQLAILKQMRVDPKGCRRAKLNAQRKRVEIEQSIFGSLPLWVEARAESGLLKMQFPWIATLRTADGATPDRKKEEQPHG